LFILIFDAHYIFVVVLVIFHITQYYCVMWNITALILVILYILVSHRTTTPNIQVLWQYVKPVIFTSLYIM